MKAPNLASIIALLAVALPVLLRLFSEAWPADAYWWAALVTGVLAAAIKAIEVYQSTHKGPPDANLESFGAPPVQDGRLRRWLVG